MIFFSSLLFYRNSLQAILPVKPVWFIELYPHGAMGLQRPVYKILNYSNIGKGKRRKISRFSGMNFLGFFRFFLYFVNNGNAA